MGSAPVGIALLLVGALSGRLTVTSILYDPSARRSRRTRLVLLATIALGVTGLALVLLALAR
jgi:ABC-type cobalamin transport system permease subunit